MKVLFTNLPYWVKDGDAPLRQGIRAGSRWPYTGKAAFAPDDFHFGGYLPFPMFMGYAAGWLKNVGRVCWDSGVSLNDFEVLVRDSVARGESYASFGHYLKQLKPDWIVVETATNSWDHDRRVIRLMRQLLPSVKFVIASLWQLHHNKITSSTIFSI